MKKEIHLNKDDLLFRVESLLYKLSKSRVTDDNISLTVETQADEGDRVITLRSVDDATSRVVSRMSAYVTGHEDGVIGLVFPMGWVETSFEELCRAVEDYVVWETVREFLEVVAPAEAKVYADRAEEAYGRIKSCVTSRRRTGRPLQPF